MSDNSVNSKGFIIPAELTKADSTVSSEIMAGEKSTTIEPKENLLKLTSSHKIDNPAGYKLVSTYQGENLVDGLTKNDAMGVDNSASSKVVSTYQGESLVDWLIKNDAMGVDNSASSTTTDQFVDKSVKDKTIDAVDIAYDIVNDLGLDTVLYNLSDII